MRSINGSNSIGRRHSCAGGKAFGATTIVDADTSVRGGLAGTMVPTVRLGPRVTTCLDDVAATLELATVRRFADGTFGAALVKDATGSELVLKALPQPELEPVWEVGASMAMRLHDRGYPSPRYAGIGATSTAVWSLQEYLPGTVMDRLTEAHARQLVALARRHDVDCGRRRPWRDDAIAVARQWLAGLPLEPRDADVLRSALDRGAKLELLDSTIVHGDFHHRNALVQDGQVSAVFDWEVASPGDWRFDLVMLEFGCLMRPKSCDPEAIDVVVNAVRQECPTGVARLMMACQVLRILSMTAVRAPAKTPILATRVLDALDERIR